MAETDVGCQKMNVLCFHEEKGKTQQSMERAWNDRLRVFLRKGVWLLAEKDVRRGVAGRRASKIKACCLYEEKGKAQASMERAWEDRLRLS